MLGPRRQLLVMIRQNEGGTIGSTAVLNAHASLGKDILTRPMMSPNAKLPYIVVDSRKGRRSLSLTQ